MILTTVGMLISMGAAGSTAVADWDETGQPVLKVTTRGGRSETGEGFGMMRGMPCFTALGR